MMRASWLAVWVVAAGVMGVGAAWGEAIVVPNGSFETPPVDPTGFPAYSFSGLAGSSPVNFWSWQYVEPTGGSNSSGVFLNPASGPTRLTNLDGSQGGFLFSQNGVAIYQTLTGPASTFEVGKAYSMTVAVGSSSDNADYGLVLHLGTADTLDLVLYATDGVTSQDVSVTPVNGAGMSNTVLQDFTVDVPTVRASDAYAGMTIGMALRSSTTFTPGGGESYHVWDVDDVRLASATPAPEPASLALLGLGALGLMRRRR